MAEVRDYRGLISGYSWFEVNAANKPIILTYSFESVVPSYFSSVYPAAAGTFAPLNENEKAVVRSALQEWSSVAGLTFIETTKHQGDLTFAFYNLDLTTGGGNAAGQGSYPSPVAYKADGKTNLYSGDVLSAGDVWFDTGYRASASFANDFRHVALHEIGHALGLKHPFDTTTGHTETLAADVDNGTNTVMSYDQSVRSAHLGSLDIAAAQYLYGPPTARNAEFPLWGYDPTTERFDAHGTANAEILRGTGTDDIIYSEGGHDKIYTAQGNDKVIANGQAIDFNGGPGIDTIVTGFSMTKLSDIGGSGDFRYIYHDGEFEILTSVERVVFTNGEVALDVQGNAGQAYRLYQAALNRLPDTGGLSWHVNRLDTGTSLHDVAANFLASPEFALRYGASPSDQAFVVGLYQNVLSRAPDSAGQAYWLGHLADGSFDRATVLTGFSESPENHSRVDPSITSGIFLDYSMMA